MPRKTAEQKRQDEYRTIENFAAFFDVFRDEQRRQHPDIKFSDDEEAMQYVELKVPREYQQRVFRRLRGKDLPWYFF